MSDKVRIPFTFVVRKVTWRPADDPLPDAPQGATITGLDGASLPIGVDLRHDPALDPLIEEARKEYFAEKAAKAKKARRRAWEVEEAHWEPMPISPSTPPAAAKLYRNMRRLKQPDASSGSDTQSDTPEDPWDAWEKAVSAATAAAKSADDVASGDVPPKTLMVAATRQSALGQDRPNRTMPPPSTIPKS